jgi:hypothetical protein
MKPVPVETGSGSAEEHEKTGFPLEFILSEVEGRE